MFDLGFVVDAFAGPKAGLSVTRRAAGTRTDGFYTPGTASTVTIPIVSLQPISGRELMRMPEGWRTREPVRVFTKSPLQTAAEPDGRSPDTFSYNGATYEVQAVEDWTVHGGYYESVATKVPTT